MLFSTIKNKLPPILTTFAIFIFFIGLFKNINYVKCPNSDFFQYIGDGYEYLSFRLPKSIHPPPFGPIIICLVSKFFPNVEHPELFSAHLINITCATLTLLNIFFIFSKKNLWLGLSIILLTGTNNIYIANSLNITNEVIFTFFLTLILLLYSQKRYFLSYLLSGFSFLIRYEAIVLVIVIFIIDFFKKNKKIKSYHYLIAIIPIIIWLIILNFHSLGNSIFQNAYINEIFIGKNDIPNFKSVLLLLDTVLSKALSNLLYYFFISKIPFNPYISITTCYLFFSFIIFTICFKNIFFKKNSRIIQIIYLIIPLYLAFTAIFPNFYIRYLFPVFWIVYFILLDKKNKNVTAFIFIILFETNIISLCQPPVYKDYLEKSEYILVSDWINQQNFKNKTHVVIYDPNIIKYFINQSQKQNDMIDFDQYQALYNKCQDQAICFLNEIYQKTKNNIFFITTSFSSVPIEQIDDSYYAKISNIKLYQEQNLTKSDRQQLNLISELKVDDDHWAKIYQYQPTNNLLSQ